MSVLEVKWIRLPLLVVHPPRPLSALLHRLHVRWRWLHRNLRNEPLPSPSEPGERMLARL